MQVGFGSPRNVSWFSTWSSSEYEEAGDDEFCSIVWNIIDGCLPSGGGGGECGWASHWWMGEQGMGMKSGAGMRSGAGIRPWVWVVMLLYPLFMYLVDMALEVPCSIGYIEAASALIILFTSNIMFLSQMLEESCGGLVTKYKPCTPVDHLAGDCVLSSVMGRYKPKWNLHSWLDWDEINYVA